MEGNSRRMAAGGALGGAGGAPEVPGGAAGGAECATGVRTLRPGVPNVPGGAAVGAECARGAPWGRNNSRTARTTRQRHDIHENNWNS